MSLKENGGTAEKAVGVIEKHGDFNGGYGSRLNVNGEEERDAVIMDGHNMKSGSYVENITVRQFIAQLFIAPYSLKYQFHLSFSEFLDEYTISNITMFF